MTNFVLFNNKNGMKVDIEQFFGKEIYKVSLSIYRNVNDEFAIPLPDADIILNNNQELDAFVTKLINNGFDVYRFKTKGKISQ